MGPLVAEVWCANFELVFMCIFGFHDNDDDIAIETRTRETRGAAAARGQSNWNRVEFDSFAFSVKKYLCYIILNNSIDLLVQKYKKNGFHSNDDDILDQDKNERESRSCSSKSSE